MDKKVKQYLFAACIVVALYAALMNLGSVLGFLSSLVSLVLPIIAGSILALFINVPMNGCEKRLVKIFSKSKKAPSKNALRYISFAITLIVTILILVLILTLLLPEIISSSKSLFKQIEERVRYISRLDITVEWLDRLVAAIDLEKVLKSVSNVSNVLLTNVVGVVSSTVSVVVTSAFALIISIYIVLAKDKLTSNANVLLKAYVKPARRNALLRFCRMFSETFSKFLSGQCTEAIILGTLMFIAFTVFRLPYGLLVGLLTTVCAIIPYIGAFVSCTISVFLILIIDPTLALRCVIVYLAVQFIENQFIYPRVVGSSVGLSPLYTLIAALIGGKLFGIVGIIFFIPLSAVLLELIKEHADKQIKAKNNK